MQKGVFAHCDGYFFRRVCRVVGRVLGPGCTPRGSRNAQRAVKMTACAFFSIQNMGQLVEYSQNRRFSDCSFRRVCRVVGRVLGSGCTPRGSRNAQRATIMTACAFFQRLRTFFSAPEILT
jgi:hypothetical protein